MKGLLNMIRKVRIEEAVSMALGQGAAKAVPGENDVLPVIFARVRPDAAGFAKMGHRGCGLGKYSFQRRTNYEAETYIS